jgi:hypothetical protein
VALVGAWGTGIKQDDLVLDILSTFDDALKASGDVRKASGSVLATYAAAFDDPDEGHIAWIGLAQAQWTYGQLDPDVLARVEADITSGAGLDLWRDAGERTVAKRTAALDAFLVKLQVPNPKPKRYPKLVVRPPKFAAGDCLSVELPDGRYGAALVLVADHSDVENGVNLIGVLDHVSSLPPDAAVCEARNWRRLTKGVLAGRLDISWYVAYGFRSERKRIQVVGTTPILDSDPHSAHLYTHWKQLGIE